MINVSSEDGSELKIWKLPVDDKLLKSQDSFCMYAFYKLQLLK